MKLICIGDLMLEVVVRPETVAEPGGEATAQIAVRAGGQALNVARVYHRLGGDATLVASVGDDEWGVWLEKTLANDGIRLNKQTSEQPTGMVVSIAADQDRTMYAFRGANNDLDFSSLLEASPQMPLFVYLSGYLLSTPQGQNQVSALLKHSRHPSLAFALDTPPRHVLEKIGRDVFLNTIDGIHKLFTTLDEGQFLTQAATVEKVAPMLQQRFGWVAIKLGQDGCWVQRPKGGQHTATTPLSDIDATGAGDAFCGGFLHALSQHLSDEDAARLANEAAGKQINRVNK